MHFNNNSPISSSSPTRFPQVFVESSVLDMCLLFDATCVQNDLWSQCSVWHRLTTQTDIVPDFISCLIFSLFYALLCLYVCVLFAPFVQCTCNSLYIIHAESLQA